MPIRVYKFGLRQPHENAALVEAQLRAAHDYRNDLVQIERGRRSAVRALHAASLEVAEALDVLRAATRSTRKEALRGVAIARERAEASAASEEAIAYAAEACRAPDRDSWDLSALDPYGTESPRIARLDAWLRRGARALTTCYWGTYLLAENAADQARGESVYEPDGVTPADPRFRRWDGDGQLGVQLQGGLSTEAARAGQDPRVRWVRQDTDRYELWMRVSSDGKKPIWARWHVYADREVPDDATWKWARVSRRRRAWTISGGPAEDWTCELTLELPGPDVRTLDAGRSGAIAVELMWTPLDNEGMRVATWLDSGGARGELLLPAHLPIAGALKKVASMRSYRDTLFNVARPRIAKRIAESSERPPDWLRAAGATMHLWKSPSRMLDLARRWRAERYDGARDAYDILQEWEMREAHMRQHEDSLRTTAIRRRADYYRCVAARWAKQYTDVLLPDRDLSREARWGEESDARFMGAPQELRGALRHAFGAAAHDVEWRGPHGVIDDGDEESDPPQWLELAIERWRSGEASAGARKRRKRSLPAEFGANKWARRKEAKLRRGSASVTARNPGDKCAE